MQKRICTRLHGENLRRNRYTKSDNIVHKKTHLAPVTLINITLYDVSEELTPSSLTGDEPEDLEIIKVIPEINHFDHKK